MATAHADDPQLTPQELLEARVDAMMDPTAQPASLTPRPAPPPVVPSAPAMPKRPVKAPAPASAVPTAPLLHRERSVTKETVVPQLVRSRPLPELPAVEPVPPPADDRPQPNESDLLPPEAPVQPLQIDTAQSDAAIADIVAQEADEVLRAEDAGLAEAAAALDDQEPEELRKAGHPIFWFFIVLLVIVIAIATVVLINPNLNLPFGA